METEKIYLAIVPVGTYDDYMEETPCAFKTKEDAQLFVDKYNDQLKNWKDELPIPFDFFVEKMDEVFDILQHGDSDDNIVEGYLSNEWYDTWDKCCDYETYVKQEAFIREIELK